MANVKINFMDLGLRELVSDDTLLAKAVACSDVLEQKIILSTMRLLNKKPKKGPTRTTGGLAQNWRSMIVAKPKGNKVVFGVENPLVYADIHNYGKQGLKSSRGGGKMLAIPLSDEARTRGSPAHWGKNELRVVEVKKSGNVFLVKNTAKTSRRGRKNPKRKTRKDNKRKKSGGNLPKFKAEFLLRNKVNIPATRYYDVALNASMEPMIEILEGVI